MTNPFWSIGSSTASGNRGSMRVPCPQRNCVHRSRGSGRCQSPISNANRTETDETLAPETVVPDAAPVPMGGLLAARLESASARLRVGEAPVLVPFVREREDAVSDCERCHHEMATEDGQEPTDVCNDCAWEELDGLRAAARAVIAAGRPHQFLTDPTLRCVCPQCASWDALDKLLKA